MLSHSRRKEHDRLVPEDRLKDVLRSSLQEMFPLTTQQRALSGLQSTAAWTPAMPTRQAVDSSQPLVFRPCYSLAQCYPALWRQDRPPCALRPFHRCSSLRPVPRAILSPLPKLFGLWIVSQIGVGEAAFSPKKIPK